MRHNGVPLAPDNGDTMSTLDTDAMREAGTYWQNQPQGSEEDLEAGIELKEYADAAADEIDRLRAENAAMRAELTALRSIPAVTKAREKLPRPLPRTDQAIMEAFRFCAPDDEGDE